MKVCIALSETNLIYLEVDELGVVEDIKVLVEVETGIPFFSQTLYCNGNKLIDTTPILESGILEGDILQLQAQISPIKLEAISLLKQADTQPSFINHIEQQNPELASIIRSKNLINLENYLQKIIADREKAKLVKLKKEAELDRDPLNLANQMEIENIIQQKNINENLKYAQEYTPEVFASVVMLYIDCKVNNIPVQAFVDSGAQNTIMSKKCAEQLGIMRLVDTRFHGQAQGVGTDKIVGRIHAINLEIGGKYFNCCFHVLEKANINILFGLDMLKRHQCCIDLHKNVLTLNAGEISIEFLSEAKLKKEVEVEMGMEMEDYAEEDMKVEENKSQGVKEVKENTGNKVIEEKKQEVVKKEEPKDVKKEVQKVVKREEGRPVGRGEDEKKMEKIRKITALGFSVKEAEDALSMCGGNEEMAASYLFSKNNPFGF